jgi:hypothetical protein
MNNRSVGVRSSQALSQHIDLIITVSILYVKEIYAKATTREVGMKLIRRK